MKKTFTALFFALTMSCLVAVDGMILLTTDLYFPNKFDYTLSESIPKSDMISTIPRGQYYLISPMIVDPALNGDGNADVVLDFHVTKPDGSVYFQNSGTPGISGKVAYPQNVMLTASVIKICFDPGDPVGTYTIAITVNDRVNSTSKEMTRTITLVEPTWEEKTYDEELFLSFLEDYQKNINPQDAVWALMYCVNSDLVKNPKFNQAMLSFFVDVFRDNPFVLPKLKELYSTLDEDKKPYLMMVIQWADQSSYEFYESLPEKERRAFLETMMEIGDISAPDGPLTHPVYMDMMWQEFYARGNYKPILRLVDTISYVSYVGTIDRVNAGEESEELMENMIREAMYGAAMFSIGSHYRTHPLAKAYLDYIYQVEELSDSVRKELGKIVNQN